jgi:hypothetical protein
MKKIVQSILIMLLASSIVFASDDILDEIDKGLDKPQTIQDQGSYPINFLKAVTDRKNYIIYKELYLSGNYSSVLEQVAGKNSVGFILFGTFSGPRGQIGDMNMQFRTTYYNNQFTHGVKMGNEWTEGLNDFELEFHNAYLRMRVLPPMFNVRIGHFYVPYGIQPWIDTHGTILQSPAMEFIGLDRDWGIAMEGQNDKLEYQVGLTRGSGMEFFGKDNNFALAGKFSTPRIGEHVNDWLGVSFLIGRIFDPMGVERLRSWDMEEKMDIFKDNVIKRWRAGIDGQKITGPARLRFEISSGQDASKEYILGGFSEVRYALGKNNRWLSSLQFENLTQNISQSNRNSDTSVRLGITYSFSANHNLQFAVSRDLNVIFGKKDTTIGLLFYGQKGGGLLIW